MPTVKASCGFAWTRPTRAPTCLSEAVLREFEHILGKLESAPPRGLVIHSGKASGFVMGADINEFTTIETADQGYELIRIGQQLFDRLEALRCPTAAVFNGFALGGGMELAMACTYRLALDTKKPIIGLPEVQLGLHPGFGGTVRSVRIAGVRAAMAMMLTGKPIRVDKALAQGFIDRIVSPDNWKQAAREIAGVRAAATERAVPRQGPQHRARQAPSRAGIEKAGCGEGAP